VQALETKIPPPIVAAIFALAMWATGIYTPRIETNDLARSIVASMLLLVGASFSIAGVISFKKAKTTINPLKPETASSLVSSGIYRVSRNPMYVGVAVLLVAWAVYLASPFALLGVIGFVLYVDRFQIQPEERSLALLFGEEFANYRSQVRRWL
jgi:protein-S-isoprenylcysteine O-methyltransferase Ste14